MQIIDESIVVVIQVWITSDFFQFGIGSDYFTENFQVQENKTKNKKYSSALSSVAFLGIKIRVWVRVQFGNSFRESIWVWVRFESELIETR